MGNWKASRSGINLLTKNILGLVFQPLVEKSWNFTEEDCWHYQAKQFAKIYEFAFSRVPYYQQHRNDYLALNAIAGEHILETLKKIPILPKATVKANNPLFWATPALPLTKYHTTSGTSGTPIRIPGTYWERSMFTIVREKWYKQITNKRVPKTLYLSGFMVPASDQDLFWYDKVLGHAHVSIYSLSGQNRQRIIDTILEIDPDMIYGYASAVEQLALLVGDGLKSTKEKRVAVVTSEVLEPNWRVDIENALCRKVYDYYSSQEGCAVVMECQHGKMHINPLMGIVEILNAQGEEVKEGEIGDLVLTGLVRRSMPLFRYKIGDVAVSTGYRSACECGLGWPTMGAVLGRSEDLVVTRDGRKIGYLCFHATKDLKGIQECQLIQKDFERFTCLLVKSPVEEVDPSYLEMNIKKQVESRMMEQVEIQFQYVSAIPKGPQGKFKAVVVDFENSAGSENKS
jgi:phenylacetate-CoA ligase